MAKFQSLLLGAGVQPASSLGDADVTGIVSDSRKVTSGSLFVCMPSQNTDSHQFLAAARESGATAALVHSPEGFDQARSLGLAAALIPNQGWRFNSDLCRICNHFFDYPTRSMKVVGVTGTNGKTTTAWLIRDMLQALGLRAAYLGTLGFHLPGEERELANTTPFPVELYTMLAEARDRGVEALAMEVSSHALEERRAEFVEYDAAVFTNLTQDHLDFHGSMEAYEAAKLRLFAELPKQTSKRFVAAVNVDDEFGRTIYRQLHSTTPDPHPVIRFGLEASELRPSIDSVKVDEIRMELTLRLLAKPHTSVPLRIPLGGSYNVYNCLSAAAGLAALGFSMSSIEESLPHVRPVPGRFEAVQNDEGIGILVDYAHTPDALEKLLDAVRPLTDGRVIAVFGCGGDRDRTKRPLMARAASERSDVTVVTSDNPRTEDPQSILDEVVTGLAPGAESVSIIDRREAIAHAVCIAKPGDVVVIAGKGHENYQIIGRTKCPMDDRELAREGLERRKTAGVC